MGKDDGGGTGEYVGIEAMTDGEAGPLSEGAAAPQEAATGFQRLIGDVQEAVNKVAQQAAQSRFELSRAELTVQTVIQDRGKLGFEVSILIVRVSGGGEYQQGADHAITLTLEPKAPAPVLSATSDRLAQAIVTALRAVAEMDRQPGQSLTATQIKVKVGFQITDKTGFEMIVGRHQEHANSHLIELYFIRARR